MNILKDIRHSLAVRLLQIVFSIYLGITVLITLAQMLNEYFLEEMSVKENMQVTQTIFEKNLANLVWEFEDAQLLLTAQGILKLPDIVGIEISRDIDDEPSIQLGQIFNKNKQIIFLESDNIVSPYVSLFTHSFILKNEQKKEKNIGKVILYSSNEVVFDKVKYNFLVIIINSIIKTIILWILFIWAFNKYLTKQLDYFCSTMENVDIDNAKTSFLSLNTFNTYELSRIEHFFNALLRRIVTGRGQLNILNKTLKEKVEERTWALKKINAELDKQLKLIDDNVIISRTDDQGVIIYASAAFCRISGYSKEELYQQDHSLMRHPDVKPEVFHDLWTTIRSGKVWQGELKNLSKQGGTYWSSVIITPSFDEEHHIIAYTAIRENITDKKIIEELAVTDELTQLYNRRHFNTLFPKEIQRAAREKKNIAFIIFDVDHFKQYNDQYGHQKGDEALKKIGQILKKICQRASDIPLRLGGEEFGVIFSGMDNQTALNFACKIKQAIENENIEHQFNSAAVCITASFGLTNVVAKPGLKMDDLYKQADEALYLAKDSGRNKVVQLSLK